MVQYEGGYTDYLNARQKKGNDLSSSSESIASSGSANHSAVSADDTDRTTKNNWKDGQTKKKKMSYQEQKDFETIEEDIAKLEEQIETLDQQILKAASDFVKLGELTAQKEQTEALLEEKMDRWLYLEELAAELGAQ